MKSSFTYKYLYMMSASSLLQITIERTVLLSLPQTGLMLTTANVDELVQYCLSHLI